MKNIPPRITFLFSLMFAFYLMASAASGEATPKAGGVLIWGRAADSVTLDPAKSVDGESARVSANIYEGLVRYKDDSTEIEPSLAVSWNVSADERQWTFHLRKGVVFHDGSPFNAEAVAFSIKRQVDQTHPFYEDGFNYAKSTFKYLNDIEIIDDYTIRIILEKPYAPFLYNLRMRHAAPIVNPAALKKWGKAFEKHPSGTGPFSFVEWIPNDRIVLKKNPMYWGAKPYLDRVVFKVIQDNKNRLLALKTGAIHGMEGIDPTILKEVRTDPELKIETKPDLNIGYLAMNCEKEPFQQKKVRQAINYAINKRNLVRLLYQDMAIPAVNPIPPYLWSFHEGIEDYAYSPEKARSLLKEAGYEQGFKTTLWAMPVARPYMPQPDKIANAIKANLALVGIECVIMTDNWKDFRKKLANGEHDMCLVGWIGDNGDPDNFFYVLLDQDNAIKPNSQNFAFFRNESLHRILIQAQQYSDKAERTRLYRQAQEIIHEEAPWAPLVHAYRLGALRSNVHGVIRFIQFEKAWVD